MIVFLYVRTTSRPPCDECIDRNGAWTCQFFEMCLDIVKSTASLAVDTFQTRQRDNNAQLRSIEYDAGCVLSDGGCSHGSRFAWRWSDVAGRSIGGGHLTSG